MIRGPKKRLCFALLNRITHGQSLEAPGSAVWTYQSLAGENLDIGQELALAFSMDHYNNRYFSVFPVREGLDP